MNKKKRSFEHIIPNAIGGTLKSARLICKVCNSAYGMTIDAALAGHFETLTAFLTIARDRPKARVIQDTAVPNGDLFHVQDGHLPAPVKPRVSFDKGQLSISGRDQKQLMHIASGLKGKFPDIDLGSMEKNWEEGDVLPDELTISFSAGNDLLLRSVAKIAVNYYLMKARGRPYLDKIINVMNGVEANQDHIHYYPLKEGIRANDERYHLILIKGNNASGKLQAHVVLFNTDSFVINLCDNYDGDDIDFFYRYDVLRRQEIKAGIDLDDDRNKFRTNGMGEQ